MKTPISIKNLESIESSIRRRLKNLDENYKQERNMLEMELKQFVRTKEFIRDFLDKYGTEVVSHGIPGLPDETLPLSGPETIIGEMPWGRHASGVDKVVYVLKEAGTRGLSRLEVLDRIEEISGEKQALNSVTTWLYRAKRRGQVRNRQRRWYANR